MTDGLTLAYKSIYIRLVLNIVEIQSSLNINTYDKYFFAKINKYNNDLRRKEVDILSSEYSELRKHKP